MNDSLSNLERMSVERKGEFSQVLWMKLFDHSVDGQSRPASTMGLLGRPQPKEHCVLPRRYCLMPSDTPSKRQNGSGLSLPNLGMPCVI